MSEEKKFKGISNVEIIKLEREISKIENETKMKLSEKTDRILEIQTNYDHNFLLNFRNLSGDFYRCSKCGKGNKI